MLHVATCPALACAVHIGGRLGQQEGSSPTVKPLRSIVAGKGGIASLPKEFPTNRTERRSGGSGDSVKVRKLPINKCPHKASSVPQFRSQRHRDEAKAAISRSRPSQRRKRSELSRSPKGCRPSRQSRPPVCELDQPLIPALPRRR